MRYLFLASLALFALRPGAGNSAPAPKPKPTAAAPADPCQTCHNAVTPGIVADWKSSRHAQSGVSCAGCHSAGAANRPDAVDHFGRKVVTLVTPKECERCHAREAQEFQASYHAKAAQFIGSLDNVLGEIVGGAAAANSGCRQCHGSTVRVLADGTLDPQTWPNTGIGRVNPDGSNGSCAACHARHSFSVAVARQPENCGRCHLGPDHPQLEIYNESKHGLLFKAHRGQMRLDQKGGEWLAGRDYTSPTCASCHMSPARPGEKTTHDVGERLSWTLRPPVSRKMEQADPRRERMQAVCANCHAPSYVRNFYSQYDSMVDLYNEKFAKPALAVMDQLKAAGKLSPTPFDESIEWTYYRLWHHEGRDARMGAAMAGPDYTWWHGLFDVAEHFYTSFLPEAEALKPGISAPILEMPYHQWRKGLSKEQIQQLLTWYQQRYQSGGEK